MAEGGRLEGAGASDDPRPGRPDGDRRPFVGALGVVGILAAFAVSAAAFVLPARGGGHGWDTTAYRYAGLDDGAAALSEVRDPGGDTVAWESISTSLLPGLKALGDLPADFEDAVARQVTGDPDADSAQALDDLDALRDVSVFETTRRRLETDAATLTTTSEIVVADDEGLTLLGFGAGATADVFSPGLLRLPAEPERGDRWGDEGAFGAGRYTWAAELVDEGPVETLVGRYDDCVTTEAELTITPEGGPAQTTAYTEVWCAGAGNVSTTSRGADEQVTEVVASLGGGPAAGSPPDAGSSTTDATTGPDAEPGAWSLRSAGSVLPATAVAASTFSPAYIPAEVPVVVAAAEATGDLVALGVGDRLGQVEWRIATGGATYSRPRWDPERERVYFGASDGSVRAVDGRGLFLWAAAADDAVSATPAVVDDVVVFGSEDGVIHGVDADDGDPVWEFDAEAPVAAGGAVVGDTVVVADTAGVVRGLDPRNGDRTWVREVGAAVEAAVGVTGDGVLVADRSGTLTLLDEDGDEVWGVDAGRGIAIRAEPTVVGDHAVVVDDFGTVTAVDLDDGEVAWRRTGDASGAVAAVGDLTVVATDGGELVAYDAEGDEVQRLEAPATAVPEGAALSFTYGPSPGGGALWLADDAGAVWSVEADGATAATLVEVWSRSILDPPYEDPVLTTPVPFGDRLLVTDDAQRLLSVDPSDGAAEVVGEFGQAGDTSLAAPVLADDLLLVDLGARLVALSPEDATVQWEVGLDGVRALPPVVVDGVVVTASASRGGAELLGIDLADGAILWRRPTGARALETGAATDGSVVFAGAPVEAVDPATGDAMWTSTIADPAGGLATDGDVVVVPSYTQGDPGGRLTVLDARSGDSRWDRVVPGEGASATTRLLVAEDVVVLPSPTGAVLGFDLGDGRERWRNDPTALPIGSAALVGDRVTYALLNGQVVQLDPVDGGLVASSAGLGTDTGATSASQQPVEAGGTITVVAGALLFAVGEAP